MTDQRVDYDQIAHLYDNQPLRDKDVDPNLLRLLEQHPDLSIADLSVLDIGCGTGNQLLANLPHVPQASLIGLDLFGGMLRRAKAKSKTISWVQADGTNPPFASNSFHYISNQFSFHHVQDKPAMLEAIYQILRPGGQFVMQNINPYDMPSWLYYQYFPEAFDLDKQNFLPKETLLGLMKVAGFKDIRLNLTPIDYEQDMHEFLRIAEQRHTCSQLIAIPDKGYRAGIKRIKKHLSRRDSATVQSDHVSLLTIRASK